MLMTKQDVCLLSHISSVASQEHFIAIIAVPFIRDAEIAHMPQNNLVPEWLRARLAANPDLRRRNPGLCPQKAPGCPKEPRRGEGTSQQAGQEGEVARRGREEATNAPLRE